MNAFAGAVVRRPTFRASLCALLVCTMAAVPARAEDALVLLPDEFTLSGREAQQMLLVQERRDGRLAGQVTEGVAFESSDPEVVRVEDGAALPVGNGNATLTVRVGDRTASARVTVEGQDGPHEWSFRNHVQSVLSKTGCNTGACHGAAAGQNGFRLSLRGYDPEFDFFSITRQARGRRLVPDDPGRSLVLTKPSGAVPHKGGLRFEPGSREYQALAQWIAAGHPGPADDDPRLERLDILPGDVLLAPGARQQLVVRAHFSDGRSEDVTRWARYTSTNLTVADVDDAGMVSVVGHGEGAVVAWYLAHNVVANVTVPHATSVPAEIFATAERSNFIDDLVLQKLERLNVPPSPDAYDADFVRRAFLDTIGVLPTAEETRAFLADEAPDKRDRLIERLLARPEFVDYWAYKWSDLLLVSGQRLRPQAVDAYYKWIRERVEENAPWDRFARGVLLARGSTFENGAANFYSLHQDPVNMAETVSMAFLGMSIQCAQCHDHPLEKWTNDDYYGMANLFSRVKGKGWGGDFRSGDGHRVIFTAAEGELIQPRTGRPQPPRPLDGEPLPFDSTADRREHLAEWLTAPENPYFSRAIVNRVWANFFGVGIVEDVDDLRLTNPPSNEALFTALADYLVANGYDLKALMRAILKSKTYQRSSRPVPGNETDERFYARYYPRRLPAEVLLDAIAQVTGVPTQFKDYPEGTRALQLRDATVESYFLQTFGRAERILTCECERSAEPSMTQVLHILNGATVNEKLHAEENRLGALLAAGTPDEDLVEAAYLGALSRYPTADEKSQILAELAAAGDGRREIADPGGTRGGRRRREAAVGRGPLLGDPEQQGVSVQPLMPTLLHISDLHFGPFYVPEVGESLLQIAGRLKPDVIVASGDFTQRARREQFAAARAYLDRLPKVPTIVVPGNHDIPLYRLHERALQPYRMYQEYIDGELDRVHRVEGAVIVSLNSTAPYRALVNGRIRRWQLDFCERAFQDVPEECVRIVVAHHHFAPAPDYERADVMPRARRALDRFARLRVDLILGGHLHRAYIGNSLDVYAGVDREHGIIIVQSGTTTSRRGRARESEKNSFNLIRADSSAFHITHYMHFEEAGGFAPMSRHTFPRRKAWFAE